MLADKSNLSFCHLVTAYVVLMGKASSLILTDYTLCDNACHMHHKRDISGAYFSFGVYISYKNDMCPSLLFMYHF